MREICPFEIGDNAFKLIAKEWFLLTAGDKDAFNTMTASWGTVGELWSKRVAVAFVRNTRHTLSFMENNKYFTMSFFGDSYRDALGYCGRMSGRDVDKVKETGLTPAFDDAPYFEEARMVFVCRKLYTDEIKPECFNDAALDSANYGAKDYHKVFIGEIVKVLIND